MPGKVEFASDTAEVWALHPTFSGDLAFDIGANGGMTSAIYAEHFARVIACEPATESWEHLVQTCAENVHPLLVAVSDHDGEVELGEWSVTGTMGELVSGAPDAVLANSWGQPTGTRTVPCVTLDGLADTYGLPDFVKIDTEGHETQILAGGDTVFSNPDLRFVIEIHSAEDGDWAMRFLTEHGLSYRQVHHGYRPESVYYTNHLWLTSDGA